MPGVDTGYTLFETALGCCGIAWTPAGISGVQLPDPDPERSRRRMAVRLGITEEAAATGPVDPGSAPDEVRPVVEAIVALLAGDGDPAGVLAGAVLDTSGVPEFNQRVYEVTRSIPAGSTLSYGAVADRIGSPGAARAVGRALGDNPYPIVVPCHRVLAANGSMHGFSAPGGIATKRRMLQLEGALSPDEPTLF